MMEPAKRVNVYIDWANLQRGAQDLGFQIDSGRLISWLKTKFSFAHVFIFLGFIEEYAYEYLVLQEEGYDLIFRDIIIGRDGHIKANCDAEMVFKVTSDFFRNEFDSCVIVSGDGDFRCVIEFLVEQGKMKALLVPNSAKYSSFLRKIRFLSVIMLDLEYVKFTSL